MFYILAGLCIANFVFGQEAPIAQQMVKYKQFESQVKTYFEGKILPDIQKDLETYFQYNNYPTKHNNIYVFELKENRPDWYKFHKKYEHMFSVFEKKIKNGIIESKDKLTYHVQISIPIKINIDGKESIQDIKLHFAKSRHGMRNTRLGYFQAKNIAGFEWSAMKCDFTTIEKTGAFIDQQNARHRTRSWDIKIKKDLKSVSSVSVSVGKIDSKKIVYNIFT